MSLLGFSIERRPERAKSISPPPLSCASSLQLVCPMHYSQSLQLQVAPQRAIAHIIEFFVSELEWFIVSLYRLALPCARSPRNSQSEVCEFKGYFYLLPSPILTLLPTPYHTAYSSSFHLRCNRALRSRASNSFCTTLLDGTIRPQHRKTRARPPLELTAHFESTPILRFPKFSRSFRHRNREVTPPASLPQPTLASLRKIDRMPNDTAITRLLYAILSQKCLKDVSHTSVTPPPFPPSSSIFAPPRLIPNLPLFCLPTSLPTFPTRHPHCATPPPSQNKTVANPTDGRSTGTK